MIPELQKFLNINADLEKTVGTIDLCFGHNDLLAGNFIDDGRRLWLIDWDYAGFNSPLFDLATLPRTTNFRKYWNKNCWKCILNKRFLQICGNAILR